MVYIVLYYTILQYYIMPLRPILDKEAPLANEPTLADALAAREAQIKGSNPLGGAVGLGKNIMEIGEMFGITKSDVGRMVLKGITTGKLEFPGMKTETAKRKKLEVAVDQIIKLAWTFMGIFLVLQTFFFITEVFLI